MELRAWADLTQADAKWRTALFLFFGSHAAPFLGAREHILDPVYMTVFHPKTQKKSGLTWHGVKTISVYIEMLKQLKML